MKNRFFSEKVVEWYKDHQRDLPWRNTQEPYKIWLSEIILQQTRVIQGLPFYEKFIQHFPDVNSLAEASQQEVLRLWQGLGYYTRARNLHKCAVEIAHKYGGKFPSRFSELKQLPGIGDYTAAAIASFAFGESVAVVDGNVYRVLSRVFGLDQDITSPSGKQFFSDKANQLLPLHHPGTYNQAIMEFGALQCVPKNPDCESCDLKKSCFAYQHEQQSLFPVKKKIKKITHRYFYYFFIRSGNRILMNQRMGKDIWHGLFDFPCLETPRTVNFDAIKKQASRSLPPGAKKSESWLLSENHKHILTHQVIHARFVEIKMGGWKKMQSGSAWSKLKWFSPQQIAQLPKPVLISRYLHDRSIL